MYKLVSVKLSKSEFNHSAHTTHTSSGFLHLCLPSSSHTVTTTTPPPPHKYSPLSTLSTRHTHIPLSKHSNPSTPLHLTTTTTTNTPPLSTLSTRHIHTFIHSPKPFHSPSLPHHHIPPLPTTLLSKHPNPSTFPSPNHHHYSPTPVPAVFLIF
ncbi:hypothetical protein Pcinc_007448 [Petrolisthes cinctipes]|uniref:Uncharacterized protein n=1 Tax=Petrolisthes cinctipes TaxID=88211 RepID=A0AAE1G9E1_PETCI|nr:hypothetical protein Pcinc_007448 [Petrolisthes cinctipes]